MGGTGGEDYKERVNERVLYNLRNPSKRWLNAIVKTPDITNAIQNQIEVSKSNLTKPEEPSDATTSA